MARPDDGDLAPNGVVEARRGDAFASAMMSKDREWQEVMVMLRGELVGECRIRRLGARDTQALVDMLVNVSYNSGRLQP